MNTIEAKKQIIIAGPCAAESREQVLASARMALDRGIPILRASLEKPRTAPEWDGVGEEGIPWLVDVAMMGLVPATEVLTEKLAERFIEEVSGKLNRKVMPWLGSRHQDHKFQQNIGQMIKGDPNIQLLIKNQPWPNEKHWLGIVDHVVHGGADPSQIILCHRGFDLGRFGSGIFRNDPDFDMAMRVKKAKGLPMIIDPSHIGGSVDTAIEIAEQVLDLDEEFAFDGLMIEVNHDPKKAKTDAKQQITWDQFDPILARMQRSNLVLA